MSVHAPQVPVVLYWYWYLRSTVSSTLGAVQLSVAEPSPPVALRLVGWASWMSSSPSSVWKSFVAL